jgi:hypothetical protein
MQPFQITLLIVFGLINVGIAQKKGFSPFIWFFSAGLIGLIILLILPSAKAVEETDQNLYKSRRTTGNIVGGVLLGLIIFLAVLIAFSLNSNNYSDSYEYEQNDLNNSLQEENYNSLDSSSNSDDLMLKIIEKSIPTPMDSATAMECLELMKTSHGLSQKIMGPGGISDTEQGNMVGLSCILVCENGIAIYEESKSKLPKNVVNEFESFKIIYNAK